jgi:hypothetical protein
MARLAFKRGRISKVNSVFGDGAGRGKIGLKKEKRVEKDMINNSKATQRCFFLQREEKNEGEREKDGGW